MSLNSAPPPIHFYGSVGENYHNINVIKLTMLNGGTYYLVMARPKKIFS
jgi:hypothetical protein